MLKATQTVQAPEDPPDGVKAEVDEIPRRYEIASAEDIPCPLLRVLGDGTICYANAHAVREMGRPLGELLGERPESVLAPPQTSEHVARHRTASAVLRWGPPHGAAGLRWAAIERNQR